MRTKTLGWPRPEAPGRQRRRSGTAARCRRATSWCGTGYAAVTSRRVEAGGRPQAALPLRDARRALHRRVPPAGGEQRRALANALASPDPLRAWWELASEPRGNTLLVELTAAGNHRPALQAEVAILRARCVGCRSRHSSRSSTTMGSTAELFLRAVAAAVQGLAFVVAHDQVAGFETGARRTRRRPPWRASGTPRDTRRDVVDERAARWSSRGRSAVIVGRCRRSGQRDRAPARARAGVGGSGARSRRRAGRAH